MNTDPDDKPDDAESISEMRKQIQEWRVQLDGYRSPIYSEGSEKGSKEKMIAAAEKLCGAAEEVPAVYLMLGLMMIPMEMAMEASKVPMEETN